MKKLFPIWTILFLLSSCVPSNYILRYRYNAKLQPIMQENVQGSPIMLNGVYRENLPFRAIAAQYNTADNKTKYRIIVLNDFGIELFQMQIEIRNPEITPNAISTKITKSPLPEKVLDDFRHFFEYYLCNSRYKYGKIEEVNSKIYYKANNKLILWAQKENDK